MKASSEIVVHQATVGGAESPAEEAFLNAAEGSFFVSRINELVVLEPSPDGVPRLPAKVEQLVGKGLHNVVVSMKAVGEVDNEALGALSQVKEVLDRCVGSLRLCDVDPGLAHKLEVLGLGEGLSVLTDADAAVRDYRESLSEEGAPDESNDWGIGSSDDVQEPTGVPVAELLVQDSELPSLAKTVNQIVTKSEKRHVSLRMHFSRQITSEDVNVLTGVRDFLAKRGGQLALVSLQKEVLKWLKLLEFDREFLIVESADEADAAHQAHAAGKPVATKPAAAPPARPAPLQVDQGDSLAVTPSEMGAVEPDPLTIKLREELDKAKARAKALEGQVAQLQGATKQAQQAQAAAAQRAKELEAAVKHGERRVKELEQAKAEADRRASQAENASGQQGGDVERLEAEVRGLRKELDEAKGQASALAGAQAKVASLQGEVESRDGRIGELRANHGDLERKLSEVEGALGQAKQEAASLRKQLDAAAGGDDDAASLRRRCAALEDEKARILSEAEEEIRRLSGERQMLNEELASAGEMIERLGKELELS